METEKWSREGEKITWREGRWLLSSAVAGGGEDGAGDYGFHRFFPCFPYLSLFSIFFFYSSSFSFSFFFAFGLPDLLCSLVSVSFLLCSFGLSFFSSFFFFPPCFYRQKIGERDRGGAACCHPSTALPTRGTFLGKFVLGRRLFDVF